FTPRTQADSGRAVSVSKWTTWPRACTPRSVRPAQVVLIVAPAISVSAGSRVSCTVPPPGCVCQPRKRLPSYSSPRAIRIGERPKGRLAELREQLLCRALLRRVAVLHDFVEQLAGPILVAHFLVGLGEVELGGDFLPLLVGAAPRGRRCPAGRTAKVEADRGEIHRRRR